MKKGIFILIVIAWLSKNVRGEYTLYTSNGYLEFSGYLTTFYNYRFYPSTETDHSKNRFALDNSVFRISGMNNKVWYYTIQINTAAIVNPETSDGFIMEINTTYKAIKDKLSIKLGYDKVPFSRFSLVPNTDSPFLQRPEVARGGAFSRRDVGLTVNYSLFNKQLELYGGTYTGMGNVSLEGSNDPSGNLEYIGRAEFSWPARYRYLELDLNHINIPVFSAGIGGRYAEKKLTSGIDYPIMTMDGEKYSYSADFSCAFRGFTAQVEAVQMKMIPNDTLLLYGKPTEYFLAGGFVSQINYYSKKLKSVFAVRYDTFNPNDLIPGDTESTISYGYNYLFDGLRSCIKIHYMMRLKDKDANKIWNDDQIRIGYQLMF